MSNVTLPQELALQIWQWLGQLPDKDGARWARQDLEKLLTTAGVRLADHNVDWTLLVFPYDIFDNEGLAAIRDENADDDNFAEQVFDEMSMVEEPDPSKTLTPVDFNPPMTLNALKSRLYSDPATFLDLDMGFYKVVNAAGDLLMSEEVFAEDHAVSIRRILDDARARGLLPSQK